MELKDQVAIITGAARGIGKRTALTFVKNGAVVVAVDRLEKELHETAGSIRDRGAECLPIVTDVSVSSNVESVVKQTVDTYKKIDILINNAGVIGPMMKAWEVPVEEWDDVYSKNFLPVHSVHNNISV